MTITYIAIIGQDADKKFRAGKFNAKDLAAVQKAADNMNLIVAKPKAPEAIKLVSRLPKGKLSSTGKATVPVFKGKWDPLFESFIPAPEVKAAPAEVESAPILWADLKIGSLVIAPEVSPQENGWWSAQVIGITPDKKRVTVKWLDNLRQAPTTMDREQVAIIHPKYL
jgi:hypothetical protein